MHKLEVLKRTPGAAPGGPRVVANAGMTLSFKLPPSYARRLASAAPVVASTVPESAGTTGDVKKEEEEALSWEDQDWEARADTAVEGSGVSAAAVRSEEEEDGEWEQSAVPELPDDFPRLVVNLTRLQRQHFPPAPGMEHEQVDMTELVATVKTALHRHFTHMAEALFEQQSCFHCTYGTYRAMLDGLHAAYPEDVFALIDYPTEIDGIALHEYMHVLSRASPWKSVDYLKDCLRRCSRDMKWKMDVALELELLAEREHERFTTARQQLSDEIDDLTRLRDSFRAKLAKLQKDGAAAHGSSIMLLRKLEDIENRLLTLVDMFLEEPELEEHECDGMFGNVDGQRPTAGMNVLDMVVAMVFGRLPRDYTKSTNSEEHFQMLFDHHIHIRRLWKKDFGRLPPRSHVAGMDEEDEDERAQAVAQQASSDNDHSPYEEEELRALDYEAEVLDVPYQDLDERAEAMALGEALTSSLRITDERSSSSSKLDDWEAIHVDESTTASTARAPAGDMDGYGADIDSEESEDEPDSDDDFVAVPTAAKATSSEEKPTTRRSEPTTDALVRRHRHRALPGESKAKKKSKTTKKSKTPSARRTGEQPSSTEQEMHQKRRKEKLQREEERSFFQPFACTSALGLLQIAKENEMF